MKPVASLLIALYLIAAPACFADMGHAVSAVPEMHAGMHMATDVATELPLAHHSAMYRSLSSVSPFVLLVLLALFVALALAMVRTYRIHTPAIRYSPRAAESPPARSSLMLRLALFETAPPYAF